MCKGTPLMLFSVGDCSVCKIDSFQGQACQYCFDFDRGLLAALVVSPAEEIYGLTFPLTQLRRPVD